MSSKEELYKMLLETSPYGVLFFAYGVCVDCNPSATEILGCSRRQLLGTAIREDADDEAAALSSLKQCLRQASPGQQARLRWQDSGGTVRGDIELILRPVGGTRDELVITLFPLPATIPANEGRTHDSRGADEDRLPEDRREQPVSECGQAPASDVTATARPATGLTTAADLAPGPSGASIIEKLTGRRPGAVPGSVRPGAAANRDLLFDSLTSLPNRQMLVDTIRDYLAGHQNGGACGALLLLDIDHFKDINDSWGHSVGDEVIRKVGQNLARLADSNILVARLAGDEFLIFLADIADSPIAAAVNARHMAERIKDLVAHPLCHQGQEFVLTGSIGIALIGDNGNTAEQILQFADTAMYEAKRKGRNAIAFFDKGITEKAHRQVGLNTRLRRAVDNQEFALYVQPQLSVQTGQLVGGEALLRWVNADRVTSMPSEFIPLLEASGLIVDVGHWVIRTACEYIRTFIDAGLWSDHMRLGINVSPRQFNDPQLYEVIEHSLKSYEVEPHYLNFEVTENLLIENVEDTLRKMKQIKSLGSVFSIDDFGIGYSSMIYLKRLPFDHLKIDREFIHQIQSDPESRGVVEAIMAVSRQYGLDVTAEGVEDDRSLKVLRELGCNHYQGAYFSMPVPVDCFSRMLAA